MSIADEVFGLADLVSDYMQLKRDSDTLRQQIRNAETQCGTCNKWMTSQCPREQHSNKTGRSSGPSSQALKCDQFAMTPRTADELGAAKAKYAEMVARLQPISNATARSAP